MTESTEAADEVAQALNEDISFTDHRAKANLYDVLQENGVEWGVEIESDELDEEQRETLADIVEYTIGGFRGIINNDKFISSGVYWDLVSEYAEEFIEIKEDDPTWAQDDLDIMLEIVMPTEMSRTYSSDPIANFFTLYHSKHHAEGWLQEMASEQLQYSDAQGVTEYVEDDQGWTEALSNMAYAACVQDVAQKVRAEGHEVDLDHFEYLNE